MREIVSACTGCLATRTDPPERFRWPDGSLPDGSFCHWYGECPTCERPTRHDMLGTCVLEVAPREDE